MWGVAEQSRYQWFAAPPGIENARVGCEPGAPHSLKPQTVMRNTGTIATGQTNTEKRKEKSSGRQTVIADYIGHASGRVRRGVGHRSPLRWTRRLHRANDWVL